MTNFTTLKFLISSRRIIIDSFELAIRIKQ
jgi:hypothetical protein